MNRVLEKVVKKYVIASVDGFGSTNYLRSLHNHKWEITNDIEKATKAYSEWVAAMVLENYYADVAGSGEWVVIPVEVKFYLVNETE